ncbi:hypothetical protein [Stenotrophomonas sp. PS02289]|uniref:hypothetical protein n=1 Tax=Stenotrophomonas sp. PS02289 TaxID=2991422 RepID=UPI002499F643|nr:hypothetical protein [Stenotrophomonas sp. PS02289]
MLINIGKKKSLKDIQGNTPDLAKLKQTSKIAVIDDNPFLKAGALAAHNFQLAELGDIRRIDQVSEYPIVVCDIRGVGLEFGSPLEGAHVLAEIRKLYPDKFLVAYSGTESDMSYNDLLRAVDVSVPKDAHTEVWVSVLEDGLKKIGDPFNRWIRFRTQLSQRGVDASEIYRLEQAFLKSIDKRDSSIFEKVASSINAPEVVAEFAKVAMKQLVNFAIAAAVTS